MNKKIVILFASLFFCYAFANAQEIKKSELQQRAETEESKHSITSARSLYIHAFNDYANKGQLSQGVKCATKAAELYYKENLYKEAFELLRRVDQSIAADRQMDAKAKAASHYLATKERLQMYIKLRKSANAMDQLNIMENQVSQANDEALRNDLLYNKAIYYYTFGQNAQGNAAFKEMANKLTSSKEYGKVDEVYQTLIANGRKSGNANMVAQSYSNYIAWKDSTSALKHADEIGALKQQIAANEETIAEKDSSLTSRRVIIVSLCVLVAILAAVLALGAIVLLRFIVLTHKQKKTIRLANESNALKAKFISNITAQLEPTLHKLDDSIPEVKAMLDFSRHVQTLSELENTKDDPVELEETQIPQYCEGLMDQIRNEAKPNVALTVKAPKINAKINKEYVTHILLHLLTNAAKYTPEGGSVTLEFKKRSPHTYQFLVSDTGCGIPEEKRDNLFKPFVEIHDLTMGDGLALPICKQMALKMKGDLDLDLNHAKGTHFTLELHV